VKSRSSPLSAEEGEVGARGIEGRGALVLLPDELAQVALFSIFLRVSRSMGSVIHPNFSISSETLTFPSISVEDVADIPRQIAGLAGRLHQALAGLGENRSTIHTLVRFIALK